MSEDPPNNYMTSDSDEAARARYEQAMVDADIERLARDPKLETMIAEWDAEGVGTAEQIERLKSYFSARGSGSAATE